MNFTANLPNYLLTTVVFLTIVTLLVAAHEYGHYLFARIFKMGVEEFAIGFGKKPLFKFMERTYSTPEGPETTVFQVRPWPLGGFVRIKGMVPDEEGGEAQLSGGFYNKSPWKRLVVLFAGPLFSVLAGLIILVPIYMIVGVNQPLNKPVLGSMLSDGVAAKAGLKVGDQVESINGEPVSSFYEMIKIVRQNGGTPLLFKVKRGTETATATVTPIIKDSTVIDEDLKPTDEKKPQGLINVGWDTAKVKLPLGAAIGRATSAPIEMVKSLAGIVTGRLKADEEVGGPLTMLQATSQTVKNGISDVLAFAGLLSISLGVFNLLPIPPFDGGQMLVAFVEMLRGGRRLSFKVQERIATIGMAAVAMLIIGVFFVDIKRLVVSSNQKPTPVQSSNKDK